MSSRVNRQERGSWRRCVVRCDSTKCGADGQKVRLLIIDEVHLLNEERGAVIETIVARTLRQVGRRDSHVV